MDKMVGRLSLLAVLAAALVGLTSASSCTTSDVGLGGNGDSGVGRPGSTPTCMSGTIDGANWPAAADYSSCTKVCGPDDLGARICSQVDIATCRRSSACVCLSSPCVTCEACEFKTLPGCYEPLDVESPLPCAATVINGGSCLPACGRSLCIEADGRTGCVCNAEGKYACATWGDGTWK
jgi:hypothetical protein